jgi:hypothetical protein
MAQTRIPTARFRRNPTACRQANVPLCCSAKGGEMKAAGLPSGRQASTVRVVTLAAALALALRVSRVLRGTEESADSADFS